MENSIQDKVWELRILGHAIQINKRSNNDAKMVNKTLQLYLDRFAIIYMDDIFLYSDTKDQYIQLVKMILDALK